ncbi:MAG: hypothetical protein QF464_20085 [Myxococcota bacterium]|nr:hypothetical protein [Myxococcota bacterium]
MKWSVLAGILLLIGCGRHDEAISHMVKVHIETPVPAVEEAVQRAMLDFMVPPQMLPRGSSTELWDRCLYDDEDVRTYFPPRFAMVEISEDMIRLSGQPLMALQAHVPAEEETRGLVLKPLHEAASQMADDARSAGRLGGCWPRFSGEVLIVLHPDTPFSIQRKVMYTLGQAMFYDFSWLVSTEGSPGAAAVPHPPINAHASVHVIPSGLPQIGPAE